MSARRRLKCRVCRREILAMTGADVRKAIADCAEKANHTTGDHLAYFCVGYYGATLAQVERHLERLCDACSAARPDEPVPPFSRGAA